MDANETPPLTTANRSSPIKKEREIFKIIGLTIVTVVLSIAVVAASALAYNRLTVDHPLDARAPIAYEPEPLLKNSGGITYESQKHTNATERGIFPDGNSVFSDGTVAVTMSIINTQYAYTYIGCFKDTSDDRALPNRYLQNIGMTLDMCADNCRGKEYFGLQYGKQCYCGDGLYNRHGFSTGCNMACLGDASQTCGGSYANSVYNNKYRGCFKDSANERVFTVNPATSNSMSIEMCAGYCAGYYYFGVSYSTNCWCGTEMEYNHGESSGCTMPCAGDASHTCGGYHALDIYETGCSKVGQPVTFNCGFLLSQCCYHDSSIKCSNEMCCRVGVGGKCDVLSDCCNADQCDKDTCCRNAWGACSDDSHCCGSVNHCDNGSCANND